jgi:hypothetical protein
VLRTERMEPVTSNGSIPAYQIAATLERYEFIRD